MRYTSDSGKNIGRIIVDDGTGELTSDSNKLLGTFRVDDGRGIQTSDSLKVIGRVKVWDGVSPVIRGSDSDVCRGYVTIDDGRGIKTSDSRKVRGTIILQSSEVPVVGLVDGDPVSLWPDSSGNGHDATAAGAARPTFKIVSGMRVVRSASGNIMDFAPISGASPWLLIAVMKPAAGGTLYTLLGNDSFQPQGIIWAPTALSFLTRTTSIATNAVPSAGFHVITASGGVTGLENLLIDGVTLVFNRIAQANAGDFAHIVGGVGDIAECCLYGVGPEPSDVSNVQQGLGVKYGVAVTGGTPISPDSAPGLGAWWKGDSLG